MNGVQVKVINGLRANFKQPSGPSRPGYDWIVQLSGPSGERKILARTYDDDLPGGNPEQQAERALNHIAGMVNAGSFHPDDLANPPFVIVPKPNETPAV